MADVCAAKQSENDFRWRPNRKFWEMIIMIFEKILCPTDFSEASYEGLQKAVELAGKHNTELCVVYVDQSAEHLGPVAELAAHAHTEGERRAEAVANLCAVLAEKVPVAVRSRPLLMCGDPAIEILRAATQENADLIVLTTHGAGGAQPSTLGRVAEQVTREANCAVLTVTAGARKPVDLASHTANGHSYDAMPAAIEIVSSKAIFLDGD